MVLSALIYPLMLVELGWMTAMVASGSGQTMSAYRLSIFVIDFSNVALGHLGFILLGAKSAGKAQMWRTLLVTLGLPLYWLLLSLAAWRAAWQLGFKPHFWEKTEHSPVE
jgi:glycosyltransferase XagB